MNLSEKEKFNEVFGSGGKRGSEFGRFIIRRVLFVLFQLREESLYENNGCKNGQKIIVRNEFIIRIIRNYFIFEILLILKSQVIYKSFLRIKKYCYIKYKY